MLVKVHRDSAGPTTHVQELSRNFRRARGPFGGKDESCEVPCVGRYGRTRVGEKFSRLLHLPSGVVEVLEVPEEAGLFPRVVGRVFFQNAGHACWNDAGELGQALPHGGGPRTHTHGSCSLTLLLHVSAGRPRAFHVVVVGGLCIVITGGGGSGSRYLRRRGGSVTDAHTPRCCSHVRGTRRRRWHRSPVGGERPVSYRLAVGPPRTSRLVRVAVAGGGWTRSTHNKRQRTNKKIINK